MRHNVQKTCNVKVKGFTPSQLQGKRLVLESSAFSIPSKTNPGDESEFFGWQFFVSMADGPLNQSGRWTDDTLNGEIQPFDSSDYLNGGCPDGTSLGELDATGELSLYFCPVTDAAACVDSLCTVFAPDRAGFDIQSTAYCGADSTSCPVGSLVLSWNEHGSSPVAIGAAYMYAGGTLLEVPTNATQLPVHIEVGGVEYETFNVSLSDDGVLGPYNSIIETEAASEDRASMKSVLKHHYALNHDVMSKGGSLIDVLKTKTLNLMIVFREFSANESYVNIGMLLNKKLAAEGVDDTVAVSMYEDLFFNCEDSECEYIEYIVNLITLGGYLDDYASIVAAIKGEVQDLNDLAAQLIPYMWGDYDPSQVLIFVLANISIPTVLDGFETFYIGGTLPYTQNVTDSLDITDNTQAVADIQSLFDSMLTDEFIDYCKELYTVSVKNWTSAIEGFGADVAVNVVGIRVHSAHAASFDQYSGMVATFDNYDQSLQTTEACSWTSGSKLVFRDLLSFPMFSPAAPDSSCDDVWHMALHIMPMSAPAAAHVSDVFYSNVSMLAEYINYVSGYGMYDTTLTHEIGHAFSYHDVYNYPETAPAITANATDTIMYQNDTVTALDKALFNLNWDLRGAGLL